MRVINNVLLCILKLFVGNMFWLMVSFETVVYTSLTFIIE
jgi:hypothetical protein